MDGETADFYDDYVAGGGIRAEAARSAISTYFASAFPPGARILDVGAGAGRDLAVLLAMGFDAYGIEPHAAMRAHALRTHPGLVARMAEGALPIERNPFAATFDGVVCSAAMMHVPAAALDAAWRSLRAALGPRGRVLLSLPDMRPDLIIDGRDPDRRLFVNHGVDAVVTLADALGFARIPLDERATSVFSDITWSILLFALRG